MTVKLRGYQNQATASLHNGYAKGLHRLGIQLPTGCGKRHTLDTEVPTPDGLRLWGDLAVGDAVYGSDGQPTEVTGVYDSGVQPMWRVTMKHGESVLAGAEHLWQVQRKGRMPKVVSTEWLLARPLKDRDGWCWSIPVVAPTQRPYRALPLDPYVVGSLIANGSLTSKYYTVLTTPDRQVIERVNKHTQVVDRTVTGYCPRWDLPGIVDITRSLGLREYSRDKHIPRVYLEASIEQRVSLLQGLMVGDGSVRQGGRRSVTYSTISPRLAEDMQELITSLGGTCSISKQDRSRDDKPLEYSLCILLPISLCAFDTDRKVARSTPARLFKPRSAITSIELATFAEGRCISVAAADQLYAVTRQHIITHNTVVIGDVTHKTLSSARHSSVDILLHRDTLVDQTIRKLLDAGVDPDDIGVVKGRRHEIGKRCRIVSIHSLRNSERLKTMPKPQLAVVDEAHVSVSTIYRNYYEWIGALPGGAAYLAGFTATWMRSDRLGLGDVWEEIVFKRSIAWAVDQGYLVRPYPLQLGGDLDMSKVRTAADGDYSEKDLGELITIPELRDTVVNAYHTITPGKSIALFAPTQASARFFAEALTASGVPVAEVFSSTKPKDRKWAFHGFETGAVKVLVTCSALAEGWDSPRCDGVYLLRRTKFAGRFIQEVGRALRPWINKELAWILDFVGTLDEKDMSAAVDLSKTPEPGEDVDQELEECDECGEYRILRYVSRIDQNLCQECFKLLNIEPEERELTAKKITGVHHIDLFERTSARWLETDFGMPFIATSDKSKCGRARIFFMVPLNGMYSVGVTGSMKTFAGGYWLAEGVTPMEAARIGSDAALDDDPTITHKNAAWRQSGRIPTQGQTSYALTLGINVDGMTMAEASDVITIKIASRTLGPVYRSVYRDPQLQPA